MRRHRVARRRAFFEPVLTTVLAAHKAGTLDELLRSRPLLTRWFARRLLAPLRAVAGDVFGDDPAPQPAAWIVLLRAALAALRPDGAPGLGGISEHDWVVRTAWRPLLALMCHAGFEPVAAFPDRYRPRGDEPAAEQLCGLWGVGGSTFYRYVDKGRRRLAEQLFGPPPHGDAALERDLRLQHELQTLLPADGAARTAWQIRQAAAALRSHAGRAASALQSHGARAALWHLLHAGDVPGFIACLQRFRIELASDTDTDALLQRFAAQPLEPRMRFELCLARAALWRVRGDASAERAACEEALRLAAAADDALMLGIVYGVLGKVDEARDPDRAFACYQDSAEFLRRAGLSDDPAAAAPQVLQAHVDTLVKLGWLYVLRNDPRSKAVLDRAEALREHIPQAAEQIAMLEQAWGEYWRRSGELQRALEHKHRALQAYERLGDREAVLKTWGNLALIYGDAKDFARAIDYSQRVLEMAGRFAVEPETVAATHLNAGAAYFWQGKYEPAIEHYARALEIAQGAGLRVLVGRAHYNMAEAFYKRFQALDDPVDERLGDAHIGAALACWPEGGDAAAIEATRRLKREILGPRDEAFIDRMLPAELAAHFEQMSQVQRHRAALAVPLEPLAQIEAQLAIARAYVEMAVKEREAAVQLLDKHGLRERFAPELDRLRDVFERQLSREQRLSAQWRSASTDLVAWSSGEELLKRLLAAGSVNKSAYAQLCGVGLATASKHLGKLAARGLLAQVGKGPSTRYVLPAESP
ncbi:tetratricopeptide repeat protein [Aquincola sp. S2]|uniref:Tetratricopeptide repeat protein n=1 Tax=Pseudaquabacterium terrae TaxID=2732868 RepID=A0ABX2EAN6_9BURK|nr:tetratricopeptide repeat protein [Aquabacterium terrae]NRF65382.1 tetratricopeptide repeat protein [Aquabacterium terrae]